MPKNRGRKKGESSKDPKVSPGEVGNAPHVSNRIPPPDGVAHAFDEGSSSDRSTSVPIGKEGKRSSVRAEVRASFYPKFENEHAEQETRKRMVAAVSSGGGLIEVSLKHSGSLFLYAGRGGAYAKNSFGNLYTAVGLFVLGKTLEAAWGAQAAQKTAELNALLERERLSLAMELVTAVLGDHGQRPKEDYVVVTGVTAVGGKPRFFSTPEVVAFCRAWRLPHNAYWLLSSQQSALSFFAAYDAFSEEGTASAVEATLGSIAEVSLPATRPHADVQGEILEGLVARLVSPASAARLQQVLSSTAAPPPTPTQAGSTGCGLREFSASRRGSEAEMTAALLEAVPALAGVPELRAQFERSSGRGPAGASDKALLAAFLAGQAADATTAGLQELLRALDGGGRQPLRLKCLPLGGGAVRVTVHVLRDSVFRKHQGEMRRRPALWPLYRGFFLDLFLDAPPVAGEALAQGLAAVSLEPRGGEGGEGGEGEELADDTAHLMIKLKLLQYKLRTFLIRNGLPLLRKGRADYLQYARRQLEIWGVSPGKTRDALAFCTAWAAHVHGRPVSSGGYLDVAEPFLEQYARRGAAEGRLIGSAGGLNTIDVSAFRLGEDVNEDEELAAVAGGGDAAEGQAGAAPAAALPGGAGSSGGEAPGPSPDALVVFFPGIPGCAKSSLCHELETEPTWSGGRPVESLMGDRVKAKYWPTFGKKVNSGAASAVWLADKNAPNVEVWETVAGLCAAGAGRRQAVPVVAASCGSPGNPFSRAALAVFLLRVLRREGHPGNLDRNSPNAGWVLLNFYHLYEGRNRAEFEAALVEQFGTLVVQPLLREGHEPLPAPVAEALEGGLALFGRHRGRDPSRAPPHVQAEWAAWESRVRGALLEHAPCLDRMQVPFGEVVASVRAQLQGVLAGSHRPPLRKGAIGRPFSYVSIALPPQAVADCVQALLVADARVRAALGSVDLARALAATHVTLAHKREHGVPAVAQFGPLKDAAVKVHVKRLIFNSSAAALEVDWDVDAKDRGVVSRNAWPHITIWTDVTKGVLAKDANELPSYLEKGNAEVSNFEQPVFIEGHIAFMG